MGNIDSLVDLVVKEGASDIHLAEGRPPYIRISGELIPLVKASELNRAYLEKLLDIIMVGDKKGDFEERKSADFSYTHGKARFRVHVSIEQRHLCITFRHIKDKIPSLSDLGLPDALYDFARRKAGFFLVVGPTGNGKSTTLASLIDIINKERLEKIVTIEDPIEYIFTQEKSLIFQREVGIDTPSFHQALEDSFRDDINVTMVGEIRSPETMAIAVTAAETGHLVFSTLHTNSAAQTIDRIVDTFPANQQNQIRMQLASSLAGVFSQRLVPKISGGVIPVYELLINNTAVSNLIRDKRTHEINSVIETSSGEGMIDFNRCIVDRVQSGHVSVENAYLYSSNPKLLEKML